MDQVLKAEIEIAPMRLVNRLGVHIAKYDPIANHQGLAYLSLKLLDRIEELETKIKELEEKN